MPPPPAGFLEGVVAPEGFGPGGGREIAQGLQDPQNVAMTQAMALDQVHQGQGGRRHQGGRRRRGGLPVFDTPDEHDPELQAALQQAMALSMDEYHRGYPPRARDPDGDEEERPHTEQEDPHAPFAQQQNNQPPIARQDLANRRAQYFENQQHQNGGPAEVRQNEDRQKDADEAGEDYEGPGWGQC